MADAFVGMTVAVVLKQPPNNTLHGRVKAVAGQTLSLEDVLWPKTGERWPEFTVQGSAIADLHVVDTNAISTTMTATNTGVSVLAAPTPLVATMDKPLPAPRFQDPAILSYGKSPVHQKVVAKPKSPVTPIKSVLQEAKKTLPRTDSPFIGEPRPVSMATRPAQQVKKEVVSSPQQEAGARSSLSAQMDGLGIQSLQVPNGQREGVATTTQDVADAVTPEPTADGTSKKKIRRSQKKKGVNGTQAAIPTTLNTDVSRNGNNMNGSVRSQKGKGWRSTPLLQPTPQTLSPAAKPAKSRRKREQQHEAQNGWATEDATDVQEMGDFDFEANHKLFDKKQIFNDIALGDTTADEDRLVSHNRIHRPGTYGGKNLHPTENVLSPKIGPKYGSNEVESTSDVDTALDFLNGRSSSRPTAPHVSTSKRATRRNNAMLEDKPQLMTASISSERALNRSMASLTGRSSKRGLSGASSPRPEHVRSPISSTSRHRTAIHQQQAPTQPHFAIDSSLAQCPSLHPTSLDQLEAHAIAQYGLTPEAITESAARCVAEIALGMFVPGLHSRRNSRATQMRSSMTSRRTSPHNNIPIIVVLAGNHTPGARALAAARHLASRNCRIIAAEAEYESSDLFTAQSKTLRRMARAGAAIKCGSWKKSQNYIKSLSAPPSLIIDALLPGSQYSSLAAPSVAAEALQLEAQEMIDWTNRSRAPVLSVVCPSGVSDISGASTVVDGEPLAVRPDRVVALGAPVLGLLAAVQSGERWEVTVADIGVNVVLKREEAIRFGEEWVVRLRYVDHAVGEES